MLSHVFEHWKTSATGVGLAVWQLTSCGRSPKEYAIAAVSLILGLVAKDPRFAELFKVFAK